MLVIKNRNFLATDTRTLQRKSSLFETRQRIQFLY